MDNEGHEAARRHIPPSREVGVVLAVGGMVFVIASILTIIIPSHYIFIDHRHPEVAVIVVISGGLCLIAGIRLLYLAMKQFKKHT
jgi:hypothetical protein